MVNGDSPLSLRIANEYVRLRDIPHTHVLWLADIPSTRRISIKDFREKIWQPINEFIQANGFDDEIDTIAYSADFPYGVNFSKDLKGSKRNKNRYLGTIASLTSMTYFARRVAMGDLGYLEKNHYFRDFPGPKIKAVGAVPYSRRLDEKQIKALRKESRDALRRKQYKDAIGIQRQLLGSHSQSAGNWYDLARSLAAAGQQTEAMSALSNAVDLGWTNSLGAKNDGYLKGLKTRPEFAELIGRMEAAFQPILLPHGFSSRYVWSNADLLSWQDDDFMDRYYLSALLAYTGVGGNSFPEVMNYLRTASASDGSRPDGTVYLMENGDVRSKTRQHLFPTTLDELARRGRRGEILSRRIPGQNGIVPVNKTDIIGAVVGSPTFDWSKAKSQMLPGAIAESLTSYGGDFHLGKQTKLTEFLRQGAAGSSGAVVEPFSFQEKFPVPLLHSYYADGCSLAEAFYQSIEYPYQLIIVGDPLTRPFARFVELGLEYPDPADPWSGTISLKPVVHAPGGDGIKSVELWIDGSRLASAAIGQTMEIDTRRLADGVHQLRLVAVEKSNIETRSYAGFDIRVANGAATISVEEIEPVITYGDDIEITGSAPAGSSITLFQGHRELGRTSASNGNWKIAAPTMELGLGPVSLMIQAGLSSGQKLRSANIELTVTEPDRLPAYANEAPSSTGLKGTFHDKQGMLHGAVVKQLRGEIKIPGNPRIKTERLLLDGFFRVTVAGFYQLMVGTSGKIRLSVNDRLLLDEVVARRDGERFLPISLDAGWHRLQVDIDRPGRPYLKMALVGDQVPALLGGETLGHYETSRSE